MRLYCIYHNMFFLIYLNIYLPALSIIGAQSDSFLYNWPWGRTRELNPMANLSNLERDGNKNTSKKVVVTTFETWLRLNKDIDIFSNKIINKVVNKNKRKLHKFLREFPPLLWTNCVCCTTFLLVCWVGYSHGKTTQMFPQSSHTGPSDQHLQI